MIETHVTQEDGEIIYGTEEKLHNIDSVAKNDVENDVLFRYEPKKDHTLRSQFIFDDGVQRRRMVAVTKFGNANEVSCDLHFNIVKDFTENNTTGENTPIPRPSPDWLDVHKLIQSFHFRLSNNRGLKPPANNKIEINNKKPDLNIEDIHNAADTTYYGLKLGGRSIAVSLHGRIDELRNIDVVIDINTKVTKTSNNQTASEPREINKKSVGNPVDRESKKDTHPTYKQDKTATQKKDPESISDVGEKNKKIEDIPNSEFESLNSSEGFHSDPFSKFTDEKHTPASVDEKSSIKDSNPVSWLPTAPGLSVFDGPTGRLVYDESNELVVDKEYDEINDVYLDDVIFYHSPAAGEVLVYTNGRVGGANQQLLLHYLNPNAKDLLSEFQKKVENLFENKNGWAIMRDTGNYQEVFNNLTDADFRGSTVSEDELDSVLSDDVNLDFGSPSSLDAIQFITYLRDKFSVDGTVAIAGSGRPDYLQDVHIVVMPSSLNYSEVSPRNETSNTIGFSRLQNVVDNACDKLFDSIKRSEKEDVKQKTKQRALANAVTEAADCAPTLKPKAKYRIYNSSNVIVIAATTLLFLAATTVYLGWSGLGEDFLISLSSSVSIAVLPWISHETLSSVQPFIVPLWVPLGFVSMVVFIIGSMVINSRLNLVDVIEPLTYITSNGPSDLSRECENLLNEMQDDLERADQIISNTDDDYLDENLENLYESVGFDSTKLIANDPGHGYVEARMQDGTEDRFDVVDPASEVTKRRIWLATGIGGGLAYGGIIALAYLGIVYAFVSFYGTAVSVLVVISNFAMLLFGLFIVIGIFSLVK